MTAYEIALAAHNEAFAIFSPIRDAYRARKIEDAEFLAAKVTYDAATAAYDAAYVVAVDETEPSEGGLAIVDSQLDLFV